MVDLQRLLDAIHRVARLRRGRLVRRRVADKRIEREVRLERLQSAEGQRVYLWCRNHHAPGLLRSLAFTPGSRNIDGLQQQAAWDSRACAGTAGTI